MVTKKLIRPQFYELEKSTIKELSTMIQGMNVSFVPWQVERRDPGPGDVNDYKRDVRAGALRSVFETGFRSSPVYIGLVMMGNPEGPDEIIRAYFSREEAEKEAENLRDDESVVGPFDAIPMGVIETTPELLFHNVGFYSPNTGTEPSPVLGAISAAYADRGIVSGLHPGKEGYSNIGDCDKVTLGPVADIVYRKLVDTLMK